MADYAFIDDPIQKVCEELREEVDKFGQTFSEEFKVIIEPKVVKPPRPAPAPVVK